MTVAELVTKSLAASDIPVHPEIAALDKAAERIELPMAHGRTVWRKWGSGPPVMLFHGGSGSWSHWIANIPVLARDYTVYAVDIPGMGDSDPYLGTDLDLLPGEVNDIRDPIDPAWQPPTIPMPALARGLARDIETLCPDEQVSLVGFSFGGMTASNVAAVIPQKIRRIILSGAAGLVQRNPQMKALATWRFASTPDELAVIQKQNVEILMVHDTRFADDLAVNIQVLNGLRTLSRKLPRNATTIAALEKAQPRIDAIWGQYDAISGWKTDDIKQEFLRIDPDSRFHIIAGGGHWVAYEGADEFNVELKKMLGG